MTLKIEAIPTRYQGYVFRSRTEARWALFMDRLGLAWTYEVEAFRVGQSPQVYQYLPDFWLPDHALWLEIKPAHDLIAWHDHAKMAAFAAGLPPPLTFRVLMGSPWLGPMGPDYALGVYENGVLRSTGESWRQCRWCHTVRLASHGERCAPCRRWWRRAPFLPDTAALQRAFHTARAERFGW